jgi:hypothetical protein
MEQGTQDYTEEDDFNAELQGLLIATAPHVDELQAIPANNSMPRKQYDDRRGPPQTNRERHDPNMAPKMACYRWMQDGKCDRDNCTFSHDDAIVSKAFHETMAKLNAQKERFGKPLIRQGGDNSLPPK